MVIIFSVALLKLYKGLRHVFALSIWLKKGIDKKKSIGTRIFYSSAKEIETFKCLSISDYEDIYFILNKM